MIVLLVILGAWAVASVVMISIRMNAAEADRYLAEDHRLRPKPTAERTAREEEPFPFVASVSAESSPVAPVRPAEPSRVG